jgi:capsular polysaccharide transport system permease protein
MMGSADQLSAAYSPDLSSRIAAYNAHVAGASDPLARLQAEAEAIRFELTRRRDLRPVGGATRWLVPHDDTIAPASLEAPRRAPRIYAGTRRGTFAALWGLAIRADVNTDRLGAFWWIGEPLIHVLLITVTVLFLHGADVHDMPSFPFAVVGVVVWLTFRTAFTASLAGPASLTLMLDHPVLTRFAVMAVRSLKGLAVNAMVGLVILVFAIYLEWSTPPENILLVFVALVFAVVLGFSLGLVAHHGALHYSGLRKIYTFLLRILSIMSGLFFVSEQVPGLIAEYVLWNPLLHVSQLARSGWFDTYESRDASMAYVLGWIVGIAALGLACAISTRRERARRGETA